MKHLELQSYAKINIGLRITGKRHDGYHNLQTIFSEIDLFDTIRLELKGHGAELKLSGHPIPEDTLNLCLKAVREFSSGLGRQVGVSIDLEKRIPIGAGLGGGSSNAAAVLQGLNLLHEKPISLAKLHFMAARIGSDVPYFLYGGVVYATGRGELLDPLHTPMPYWIVTITPPVHVHTGLAYKELRYKNWSKAPTLKELWEKRSEPNFRLGDMLINDFEYSVLKKHQEIDLLKQMLLRKEGALGVAMSGSGSTIFALFGDREHAEQVVREMKQFGIPSLTPANFQPTRIVT